MRHFHNGPYQMSSCVHFVHLKDRNNVVYYNYLKNQQLTKPFKFQDFTHNFFSSQNYENWATFT